MATTSAAVGTSVPVGSDGVNAMEVVADEGLRARKKREARASLQRAAVELVAERGFHAVTVDEIAERAGVSPRTFFNYFATKDDALFALDPDLIQRGCDHLATGRLGDPPFEVLSDVLMRLAQQVVADVELVRLRRSVVVNEPTLIRSFMAASADMEQRLADALALRPGFEGSPSPILMVSAGMAAFRTTMREWRSGGTQHPQLDVLSDHLAALGRGLSAT